MGDSGRGGFALCAVCLFSVLVGWSEALSCDKTPNQCDLQLTRMTLTPPATMLPGDTPAVGFSVDLTNDDNNNDIDPHAAGNYDCTMRYAETDIGKGPMQIDYFAASGSSKKFSADCINGDSRLQSGLFSKQTRTLTGTCTLGAITNTDCAKAKYLCLDCEVPGGASFADKKDNNNIKCDRIDDKLTCEIDLQLETDNITPAPGDLCPAKITSGVLVTQTVKKLKITNNNVKLTGSNVNDVKANTGNFKFEVLFASSITPPVTPVGSAVTVPTEWDDALKAKASESKDLVVPITLKNADCPTATHICLKVSKGTTTAYKESSDLDNNYQCCSIIGKKKCSPNVRTTDVTINPAVTFKADTVVDAVLDVTLENVGPGDIAAGVTATVENFKFVQFFAAGDYCADNTLATTPSPTRCVSTVTGPPAKNSALAVGTDKFKITCKMTLPATACKTMKRICVEFEPGTDATYADSDTTDNCRCTGAGPITRFCKPNVKAVTLEENGFPITFKGYVTNQDPFVFNFKIINTGSAPESNIPVAATAPANFGAKCFMATATNVKIGAETPATITAQENAALTGGDLTGVTLTGNVAFVTLASADCPKLTKVCCTVFAPTPTPQYVETSLSDNEICTTTAVHTNCKPVFPDPMSVDVQENTGTGTLVYTLTNQDPDNPEVTQTFTYKKNSGDATNFFSLDTSNGKLTIAKDLDYETITPKTFEIEYEVKDQDAATSTGTLTINIIDVNDKPTSVVAFRPTDPTTISSNGKKGTSTGPNHIAVPESYAGTIFDFTFADEDTDDVFKDALFSIVPGSLATVPAGGTGPFSFTKDTANSKGVLSIKEDKGGVTKYTFKVQVCDNGPPQPPAVTGNDKPLCSDPIDITVDVIDVDNPPTWNKPFPVGNIKEDVTAANTNVVTVTATDIDNTDLTFKCQCNPVTNQKIFFCTPTNGKGKELTIQHKADPDFDYETTPTYTCYVFAMDGTNVAVMDKVTINIENVNEEPKMNLPLTNIISVPELHCYGCHLYDYKCTDPDAGQTLKTDFGVYVTPFDLQAKSKFQLDSLDRLLLNFENNIIRSNLDKYAAFFKCCDDATPPKCDFKNITLKVEPSNQAPYFNPNTTGITIYEGGKGINIPLDVAKKFNDPEGNDATGCKILPSRYSSYFTIGANGGGFKTALEINYDTYVPPHHFYVSISCSDGGNVGNTDAPDVPPLSTEMLVEVNVLGLDDNTPVFAPTSYTATLFEDAFSTQSVVRVTATDGDLGVHGQMIYQLDPNEVLANELFAIVRLDNNVAEIRCRGGLDVEKYSSVEFKVNAVSPGPVSSTDNSKRTGIATVTVYVRNVNDLRPQWVTPDYINLEISTTAKVDKLMTTVSCTDADLLYNNVNYDQISVTFGGSDYFKTDVYTGEVRSNYTPYEEDDRYFVRVVCKDTDPKEDFSGIAIVRIDTYVNWKHVSNWTLCKPMADYKASDQEAFLASVATLCPPCIPKIHDITETDGKAVFHLYFIKDNTTYAKNAREYDKVFLETDDIMKKYYDETLNGPKQSVKDDPVFGGCLVNITRFADEPKDNWFLDTIGGNFMIGFLMSIAFGLMVTAVICCTRKAAPGRVRIPVTPKGRRQVASNGKKAPVQQKPTTPAPKKQKRPPTPESESDEESEPEPSREPTPKPIRKKFDKFV